MVNVMRVIIKLLYFCCKLWNLSKTCFSFAHWSQCAVKYSAPSSKPLKTSFCCRFWLGHAGIYDRWKSATWCLWISYRRRLMLMQLLNTMLWITKLSWSWAVWCIAHTCTAVNVAWTDATMTDAVPQASDVDTFLTQQSLMHTSLATVSGHSTYIILQQNSRHKQPVHDQQMHAVNC